MTARKELEKEIQKKSKEIDELESKILEARGYLAGIQKAIKFLPPDIPAVVLERKLRHGSDAAKAQELIRKVGRPLHVMDILNGIGKANTKPNRISLSGSLAHHANAGQVFVKTAPRTFGLIGFSEEVEGESTEGDNNVTAQDNQNET